MIAESRSETSKGARPIRLAVLHFAHETVTFLGNDTTLADFVHEGSPATGEALLSWGGSGYFLAGFAKAAREHPEVTIVPIESPLWPLAGTASGWVTTEAFEHFSGKMLAELRSVGPIDGVYLALHGAMAVRGIARPEAELARRVRAQVGRGVPIVGTFDPHGNQSGAFLEEADLAFSAKYYPHYDSFLQGERAVRALLRLIGGRYKPTTKTIKLPILTPGVMQWTGASPWMDLVQRALTWEAREPDLFVNFFFGFPFGDSVDLGITIQAQTNANQKLADRVARDMADAVWRQRASLVNTAKVHSIAAGVTLAKEAAARGATPIVLADHSDRTGSATWLLREIIAQGLSRCLIATIADAETTKALQAQGAKAGDPFDREIGGRVDPSAGAPVRVTGTVLAAGPGAGQFWVVVGFGDGNVLVLSTYLAEIQEPHWLAPLGVDPARFAVIAIKSRVHFRRGFGDSGFARTILLVEPDEPFLGTTKLAALPYRHADAKSFYPYGDPSPGFA